MCVFVHVWVNRKYIMCGVSIPRDLDLQAPYDRTVEVKVDEFNPIQN